MHLRMRSHMKQRETPHPEVRALASLEGCAARAAINETNSTAAARTRIDVQAQQNPATAAQGQAHL
jgi:hypothetical protein